MTIVLHQVETYVLGRPVLIDHELGHLMVSHDGAITWDELQAIKNEVWGKEAQAIEIYPRESDLVNSGFFRHLWRLGDGDFCPDLLGHRPSNGLLLDALEDRHLAAWAEAAEVFG